MKLNVGDTAPDFELPMTGGGIFHLNETLNAGKIVLYFYPKDFTPGCTVEACGFRDEFTELAQSGLRVYGISTDSMESHERFKKEYNLPFELLSDRGGKVAKMFGAFNGLFKSANRVSFVIDRNGKILSATKNMFAPKSHIRAAREAGGL